MRLLRVLGATWVCVVGLNIHAMTLDEMWKIVQPLTHETIGVGVELRKTDSETIPAQLYIDPKGSYIEYSEPWRSRHTEDQFQFVLYHQYGHLFLKHQERFDEAEAREPGSGEDLIKEMILESDQFATLAYLKFGRSWPELESLVRELLARNTKGPGYPSAEERSFVIQRARQFFMRQRIK